MCIRIKGKGSNIDANARVKTKVGISCLMNIEEKVPLKLTRLCCVMMRLKNSISKLIEMIVPDEGGDKDPRLTSENNSKEQRKVKV